MQSIRVTLGGLTYDVQPLPIRASREWRTRLHAPLDEIMNSLSGAMAIEISKVDDLITLGRNLSTTLIGSPDLLLDLLLSYSPELEKDRERIETDAFDDEIAQGLVQVMKVVFPLGRLMTWTGQGNRSTS